MSSKPEKKRRFYSKPDEYWQQILRTIKIRDIPFDYMTKVMVVLKDGSQIRVANSKDLYDVVLDARKNSSSEEDPVDGIEFRINFPKLKESVDNDVKKILNTIQK